MTNNNLMIKGKKGGGGSQHTPVESPDSLLSVAKAKILIALCEGEIAGGLTAQDIYLDGTPLANADGTMNFTGVSWELRTGTQDQDYIQGFPAVENEQTIGTELKAANPYAKSITNTQLSAVRVRLGVQALQRQHDNGDVTGSRVEYAIDVATDGGSYQEIIRSAFDGKTTSLYERSHRINLPKATTGWMIRVRRLTADSSTAKVADKTNIQAITEIIDAKLSYPNTALLYVEFDSKQFQSIPKISCKPKGRVIRVPNNYDPITRTYSGLWNGQFKWAWTNNPAWVFFDIVTNERFGLGKRISLEQIDKWELYRIAQYCDELVPDGRGGSGTEPRFICDVYIQSKAEAYTVLRDLAAIFRGMTYWSKGILASIADMPADIDYIYTPANVVDGKFNYSGAAHNTKYSTVMVSWSNPDNQYQDEVAVVSDPDLVRRYGYVETSITAIGCTRESEARRRADWILQTNRNDRTISFNVGLDGNIPRPGGIIGIADPKLSGRVLGGRISAVNGRNITLDRKSDAKVGDRLIINLPSGKAEARTIQGVKDKILTVSADYSEAPMKESVWSIDADDLAIQQFRVVSIADNNDGTYAITATSHDPDKYARIDNGARIESKPISVVPSSIQKPVANVVITSSSRVEQGINIATLHVEWDKTDGAISYESEWRKDNGNWIPALRSSVNSFDIEGIYSGRYQARVRAINASDISSGWSYADEMTITGKAGKPPMPVGFTTNPITFGIQLNWYFPAEATDTLKTEIWYNTQDSDKGALLLADISYPQGTYQQMGLSAGQMFFYKARLVDKLGNQSDWTDWIQGISSTSVDDIEKVVTDALKESDVFKQLNDEFSDKFDAIEQHADDLLKQSLAIISNATANDEDIQRQRKQNGKFLAEITRVEKTVVTESEAMAEAIQNLKAQMSEQDHEILADILQVYQVIANEKEATAKSIEQLQANFDDIVTAKLVTFNEALVDLEKAQAYSNQILEANIDGLSASLNTQSNVLADLKGNLSSTYSISAKISSNGVIYAAGMSLGVEEVNGKTQANVVFLADNFSILNSINGTQVSPFFVNGGQVFMRNAVIQDGSITNAKIGDFIQSNDFVTGKTGWRIDKSGKIEINGSGLGGRISITNNRIDVFDEKGVLRVRMGEL
ncbi:host specificity protein J [Thorsellia anophelis]|uniref:Phage-related protein, tail component n=1 Tax=Thorsellia anophelis DSM 18579 TaxID=1123402 RepID=A0A1I0D6I2_9GAMM|nr:host specificity protein J [Thorsellia anophelis]SET27653.1 Phage-related protein, tail component [Thorsellia anophelis DSM 18579]